MRAQAFALLVTEPGPLRDGLRTLVSTIPRIATVGEAHDTPSALDMVITHRPALLLLDADLPDSAKWVTLKRIKAGWPHTRCLVLADDSQGQQKARAADADAVLLKGLPPAKLVEAIEALLPVQRD